MKICKLCPNELLNTPMGLGTGLCSNCRNELVRQDHIEKTFEMYGGDLHEDSDLLAGKLLKTVVGIRQVLRGNLKVACAMSFAPDDAPWCNVKANKHSCYCPVSFMTKILELTEWAEPT